MSFEEIVEGGVEERGKNVMRGIEDEQVAVLLHQLECCCCACINAITVLWMEVEDCVSATGEMEQIRSGPAMESVVAVPPSKGVVVASTAESVVVAPAA